VAATAAEVKALSPALEAELEKAQRAMACLSMAELKELKALKSPPGGVREVFDVVGAILGLPVSGNADARWKKIAAAPNLLQLLATFDLADAAVGGSRRVKKAKRLVEKSWDFGGPEDMARKSRAAAGLCAWCLAVIAFHDASAELNSRSGALGLNATEARLKSAREAHEASDAFAFYGADGADDCAAHGAFVPPMATPPGCELARWWRDDGAEVLGRLERGEPGVADALASLLYHSLA